MVSVYGTPESPFLAHQGIGAMLVFVAAGLWSARRHLRRVFSKARSGGETIDDSREMLSYRSAVTRIDRRRTGDGGLALAFGAARHSRAPFPGGGPGDLLRPHPHRGRGGDRRGPQPDDRLHLRGFGGRHPPWSECRDWAALAYTYIWHGRRAHLRDGLLRQQPEDGRGGCAASGPCSGPCLFPFWSP